MLLRLIDFLKARQITALFIEPDRPAATPGADATSASPRSSTPGCCCATSSSAASATAAMYVLKSRGMAHSNQIREFVITPTASSCVDVYIGPEGVLTGSMRIAQEAREQAAASARIAEESSARSRPRTQARGVCKRRSPRSTPILQRSTRSRRARPDLHRGKPGRRRHAACNQRTRAAEADLIRRDRRRGPTRDRHDSDRRQVTVRRQRCEGDERRETWSLRLYVAGQTPKSLARLREPQAAVRGAPRRPL